MQAEGDQIVDLDNQLAEMIALRDEGKIGAIGISAVPLDVLRRALPAGIACVQNAYSVLDRSRKKWWTISERGNRVGAVLPAGLVAAGLPEGHRQRGGAAIAGELGVTAAQVGLAWLLAHAPNTLLIPGTRSIAHLEENIGAADITLDADVLERLDAVSTGRTARSISMASNPSGRRRPPDYCGRHGTC